MTFAHTFSVTYLNIKRIACFTFSGAYQLLNLPKGAFACRNMKEETLNHDYLDFIRERSTVSSHLSLWSGEGELPQPPRVRQAAVETVVLGTSPRVVHELLRLLPGPFVVEVRRLRVVLRQAIEDNLTPRVVPGIHL